MNEFERRLIESPDLPTLPAIAQRILELGNQVDTDLIHLSNTISADPSIATRILRLINSPAYGLPREIVSIREAVLYLGFNAVRSVALSFSFLRSLREGHVPSVDGLNELWRTSLMNALATRRLAQEVGGWDGEEAFLAGLISDCGTLLMYKLVPEYPDLVVSFRNAHADLLDLEQANLETDHMRLGELLLEAWRFPEEFRMLIAGHHDSSRLPQDSALELRARVLTASWLCARALTVPAFAPETLRLDRRVAGLLGLPVPVVRAIASELPDELRETAAVFEIPAEEQLSFDELLVRANQRLSELALEGEQAQARAREEGERYERVLFTDLRRQFGSSLSTDEASGLLSRDSFETVLEAFFRRAREARSSLGLAVVELDELKTLGSEFTGEVVREVRSRVEAQTRNSDVSARFSEDQVTVLIAGCWPADLEHVAERIRVEVEGRPFIAGGAERSFSVAIGIATATPHLDALDPRAFVRLAFSALDRAKGSPGRIAVEN
jgi:diguanylate cyclase (GGDEF)-like protein